MRKPFFRKQTKSWYVWHRGKQLNLGPDEKTAHIEWNAMVLAANVTAANVAVAVVVESYLEWAETHLAPATYNWYGGYLASLCTAIGTHAAAAIRPHDITKWITDAKYAEGAERAAIRCAKRVFTWATEQGLLATNPLRSMKIGTAGRRDVLISRADHKRILAAVKGGAKDLILALSESGCRPGEVARCTAANFDAKLGAWVFTRHKTSKKTGRPRVVYLSAPLLALTKRLTRRHPVGHLFLNMRSKPWTQQAVRCLFRALRKKLDLPAGTVAYSYRHTFITNALMRGVATATVAELAGTSVAMIERHYGHLGQKTKHLRSALKRATG